MLAPGNARKTKAILFRFQNMLDAVVYPNTGNGVSTGKKKLQTGGKIFSPRGWYGTMRRALFVTRICFADLARNKLTVRILTNQFCPIYVGALGKALLPLCQ